MVVHKKKKNNNTNIIFNIQKQFFEIPFYVKRFYTLNVAKIKTDL